LGSIRKYLDNCGFDWKTGKIILQKGGGWDTGHGGKLISNDDPALDIEFDDGFGGPDCPRYVASDKEKIYFPEQYDGATGGIFVFKNIKKYLGDENETPYPGG